jgi:hypothetical protein
MLIQFSGAVQRGLCHMVKLTLACQTALAGSLVKQALMVLFTISCRTGHYHTGHGYVGGD